MKTSLKSLLLGTLLFSSFAMAGSETGGGGTYVLRDGEYVISDRYFDSVGPIVLTEAKQYYFHQFPTSLHTAFQTVSDFMLNLGIKAPNVYGPYLVMPQSMEGHGLCNTYVPNLNVRTEAQKRYGCTNGNITFIYMDVLNQASIRQQAYAILHERLWTLPNANQKLVVDIVDGVMTLEEESEKQKKGQLEPLSEKTKQKLENLYAAARAIGLELTETADYEITEHGGRLKKSCLSSESTGQIIGIGSEVVCTRPNYKMDLSRTVILNSSITDLETVKDSFIADSKMRGTRMFPTMADASSVMAGLDRSASYVEGVRIKSSVIYGNLITPKDPKPEISIENSALTAKSAIRISEDVKIKDSVLIIHRDSMPIRIVIGEGTRIDDLKVYTPYSLVPFPPTSGLYDRGYYADALMITIYPKTKIKKFNFFFKVEGHGIWEASSNLKFGAGDFVKGRYRAKATDSEGTEFFYNLDKRLKLVGRE